MEGVVTRPKYLAKLLLCFIINLTISESFSFYDEGKWDFELDEKHDKVSVMKSLFKESEIRIQITCQPKYEEMQVNLSIRWTLSEIACWQDYVHLNEELSKSVAPNDLERALGNASTYASEEEHHDCANHNIQLKEAVTVAVLPVAGVKPEKITDIQSEEADIHGMPLDPSDMGSRLKRETQQLKTIHTESSSRAVFKTSKDGFYMLTLYVTSDEQSKFSVDVHIEMKGKHGYLSAADWPLLPFYFAMCLVYVVLGLAWLIVSFLQWRDLLRIQFWIGGVILLGMMEKAMFYEEYLSINKTGQCTQTTVLLAELVSCGKRTLARMLVIIVSLGFGIVKPRLGPMLHRTVATGIVYFLLASSEAYLRIMRPKSDPANQMLVAAVPLSVLDSAICWWIFTNLVQTTRTLRLRRNIVKLNLYRHFTNTLIFAVISSVFFMLYSIKAHFLLNCYTAWKELWVEDAFWKLLFSVILLVIMILWRPTNNNQRYAFTPLLDAPEDEDEDEEEYFVSDAYGVKMRGGLNSGTNSPKQKLSTNSAEEDLKWVEENIPTSLADSALPLLDSDEEVMNTKFELSKMQ